LICELLSRKFTRVAQLESIFDLTAEERHGIAKLPVKRSGLRT